MAEVNKYAIKLLWEGLNAQKARRKVYYYPFNDGYVMLLVTDEDGNTQSCIRPKDLFERFLDQEQWSDLPEAVRPVIFDDNNR